MHLARSAGTGLSLGRCGAYHLQVTGWCLLFHDHDTCPAARGGPVWRGPGPVLQSDDWRAVLQPEKVADDLHSMQTFISSSYQFISSSGPSFVTTLDYTRVRLVPVVKTGKHSTPQINRCSGHGTLTVDKATSCGPTFGY